MMGRKRKLKLTGRESLTPAEINVLRYVAKGLGNEEIANCLFISKNTLRAHLQAIYKKLYVAGRLALVIWAQNYFKKEIKNDS